MKLSCLMYFIFWILTILVISINIKKFELYQAIELILLSVMGSMLSQYFLDKTDEGDKK